MNPAQKGVPWLTSEEAATHLGKRSLNAFHKWLERRRKAGRAPRVYWLDGRMRFRQTDLDACVGSVKPGIPEPLRVLQGGR
jgi:hypothetical protein